MKWSMAQLQKTPNGEFIIDETVNLDSLKERDSQIRHVSPIHVKGTAVIDAKKVIFHLHITGELILPSSRTLADVHFPIDIKTEETFLYEIDDDDPDEDLNLIEGETIDLLPVLEDLILLEIPIQIINEDEPIPSSQRAGEGWSYFEDESELKKDKIDPRLAKLKELLDDRD